MAITQINPISSTLTKAIDYIIHPDKTDGKMLIYGFHCTPEMAAHEFEYTKRAAGRQGGVLAHHLIQSFKPGEVSYEMAHEIGKKLMEQHLDGKYEFVLATHVNCGHIHNHIIFNSVPITLEPKYQSNSKSYYKIRKLSDDLCAVNNLSVVVPKNEKTMTYKEFYADKAGRSWKSQLRETIDRCIIKAKDWEEFLAFMRAENYEIKQGKHISFRAENQQRFTRGKTLGNRYSENKIKAVLSGKVKTTQPKAPKIPKYVPKEQSLNLIIDIENTIKIKQSAGYTEWATRHNLKMAAMTMNYLADNNMLLYDNIIEKHDVTKDKRDSSLAKIKTVEKRIKLLDSQIKDLDTFRKNKPIVDKLTSVVFKEKYKREHENEFILFNAAKQSLKEHFPDGKYPLIKNLRAEVKELYEEKERLYEDYNTAKEEFAIVSKAKTNVDYIFDFKDLRDIERAEQERTREQNKKSRDDLSL